MLPSVYKTLPDGVDESTMRAYLRRQLMDSEDPTLGTTAYLTGLMRVPPPVRKHERASVSGGDVIGLAPDQTAHLMDSIDAENRFNAELDAQAQARRDRAIEGLGQTVFRAREMEQARRDRAAEREYERAQPRFMQGPNGQISQVTPSLDGSPATVQTIQDAGDKPNHLQRFEYTKMGADGKPVRMFRTFDPQSGQLGDETMLGEAPVAGHQGAGGSMLTPSQAAYTIDTLRRQGLSNEQIAANFKDLAPFLSGVGSGADQDKQKFIETYVMRHGADKHLEAEQAYAGIHGLPVPLSPIADAINKLGLATKTSRKEVGQALIEAGYPGPEVLKYLNDKGLVDNIAWFTDHPTDPGQWTPPQSAATTHSAAGPALPLDQNNAAMLAQTSTPGAPTNVETREKDGMKFVKNAEGKWVRVQ